MSADFNPKILTDSLLAGLPAKLRLTGKGDGKYRRCGCPFHGSDNGRSLRITIATGRFQCFTCKTVGYTQAAHDDWQKRKDAERAAAGGNASRTWTPKAKPRPWEQSSGTLRLARDAPEPEPLPADWLKRYTELQARLPEAAEYLEGRRIPLELVRRMGGAVGDFGGTRRLILPHTDPQGRIVSLYGRRIDGGADHKHRHLADRARGAFNAPACNGAEVWLCEAAFDALALMAAGIPHAVAIFGVDGIRWNWLKGARRIVLAFDADKAGAKGIDEHSKQALMRGAEVLAVTPDELGGAKDIAEAWAAGTLNLGGPSGLSSTTTSGLSTPPSTVDRSTPLDPPTAVGRSSDDPVRRLQALVAALPDYPPAGLSPAKWADYRASCNRFVLERGAQALTLGWTEAELFALPPAPGRPWNGGGLWVSASEDVTDVTPEHIRSISRAGNVHTFNRCHIDPETLGPLPWEATA
jgi:hypothetical protein